MSSLGSGMSRLLGSCRGFCTARTVTPLGAVYRAHGVPADVLNGTSKELLNGTFAKRVTHNPCTMTVESLPTLTLPGPGEVLLRMLAAPVNPADITQLEVWWLKSSPACVTVWAYGVSA